MMRGDRPESEPEPESAASDDFELHVLGGLQSRGKGGWRTYVGKSTRGGMGGLEGIGFRGAGRLACKACQ